MKLKNGISKALAALAVGGLVLAPIASADPGRGDRSGRGHGSYDRGHGDHRGDRGDRGNRGHGDYRGGRGDYRGGD